VNLKLEIVTISQAYFKNFYITYESKPILKVTNCFDAKKAPGNPKINAKILK